MAKAKDKKRKRYGIFISETVSIRSAVFPKTYTTKAKATQVVAMNTNGLTYYVRALRVR